jgi:hypothetical protein
MKMNGYSLPVPLSSVKKIVSDELRIPLFPIFVQKKGARIAPSIPDLIPCKIIKQVRNARTKTSSILAEQEYEMPPVKDTKQPTLWCIEKNASSAPSP